MSTSIHQKHTNATTLDATKPEKLGKKEVRAQAPKGVEDALTLDEDTLPSQADETSESTVNPEPWQLAQLSLTDTPGEVNPEPEDALAFNEETRVSAINRVYTPLVLLGSAAFVVGATDSNNGPLSQDIALTTIKDYAQRNASSTSSQHTGEAPTLDKYNTAGIRGVNKDNIQAINNILESAIVTGDSVSTKDKLQEIVDSYNSLLVLTDGNPNNATAAQALTVEQIGNLGIDTTGLTSGSQTAQRMGLLNSLLDKQNPTDVDSVAKIEALVSWVTQLSDFADGKPNAVGFKLSDFDRTGVTGVKDTNLKVLLDEIRNSGAGSIDSLSDITVLIDKSNVRITDAYKAIQDYAQANLNPSLLATGKSPSLQNYQDVGAVGVDDETIRIAVNSALTTLHLEAKNLQNTADIQKVVDAYNAVFTLALGGPNSATSDQQLTIATLNILGLDTTDLSRAHQAQRLSLLNNVLDAQDKTGVNTITKVSDLVTFVSAIEDLSGNGTPTHELTKLDFDRMGVTGVETTNLKVLLDEIKNSGAGSIDSLSDITALIDKSNARITDAFKAIQDYAQANESPGQQIAGTQPSRKNYQDVGVVGVDDDVIKDAVNSALTTLALNKDKLQTTDEIQKVVDAYNAVFTLAKDGSATSEQAITIQKLNNLGIDTTGLTGDNATQRLSLLNNVLDAQDKAGVDNITKVNELVKIVSAIEDLSGNGTPTHELTKSDFDRMGVTGVETTNLMVLLDEIKKSGAGTIDSLNDITELINKSNARIADAFQTIQNFAQDKQDPSQYVKGEGPSLQNYQDIGVVGVDNDDIRVAVNSAMTTSTLNKDKLQTTVDIQKVVDAYNAVFALAEGTPNNATAQQAITPDILKNMGVDPATLSSEDKLEQRLKLLNNVLDAQEKLGVNTIDKVYDLVKFVKAIADQADGNPPAYEMKAEDFARLGILGLDENSVADILQSIAAQKDHSPSLSLALIKDLVNFYKTSSLILRLDNDTGLETDGVTSNAGVRSSTSISNEEHFEYSVDADSTYSKDYLQPTSNGTHTVRIRQVSKEGYLGKSSSLTFTLDTNRPDAPTLDAGILYFGKTETSIGTEQKAAPNAQVPDTQDIAKIQLTLEGVDKDNDKWLLDGFTINLDGITNNEIDKTVAGVNVDWKYTEVIDKHTITLLKSGGGTFTDAEVGSIEKAMAFKSAGGLAGQRTLSLVHIDIADNVGSIASRILEIDTTSPVIQLNPDATNYTTNTRVNTQIALSNAATITDEAPIKSLSVTAKNFQDNESLLVNNASISMYGSNASGTINTTGSNGIAWLWTYDSINRQVTFIANNGLQASAAQASALLQAMQYQNTSIAQAHSGKRELIFKTTDAAGNVSEAATTSINYVATVAKVATTSALDVDGDGVLGDQFVISFTELVRVDALKVPGNWTIKNTVTATAQLGTPKIEAVDVQTIDNVQYAKHFWIKQGNGSANWVAGQQQTFNFGSQTSTQQAYLKLPKKTFGGDLTLEAWLNMDATPGSFARIFDLGTTTFTTSGPNSTNGNRPQGSDNIIFGFNAQNKLFFQIYNGQTTTNSTLISDTVLTAKTWYHLAVTIDDNNNATIYINGVADKSGHFDFGANTLERDLNYINKSAWNGDGYLSGNMFDARVYDSARSIVEINNDMKGMVDPTDTKQKYWYNLNGNLNSGLNDSDAAIGTNTKFTEQNPGTTFTINANKVVDTTGQDTADQTATLYKSSNMNGTVRGDTLEGTSGDDFITGQGGDDNLTGGAGRDVFAWLKGNTGTDTVTDFKLSEGDQIHLGSILQGAGVQSSNMDTFLEWTKVGNDMQLKIHLDGNINNSANQTIVFSNGANQDLDISLTTLVSQKTFVLDAVV